MVKKISLNKNLQYSIMNTRNNMLEVSEPLNIKEKISFKMVFF